MGFKMTMGQKLGAEWNQTALGLACMPPPPSLTPGGLSAQQAESSGCAQSPSSIMMDGTRAPGPK
jgi:hypothetical protein